MVSPKVDGNFLETNQKESSLLLSLRKAWNESITSTGNRSGRSTSHKHLPSLQRLLKNVLLLLSVLLSPNSQKVVIYASRSDIRTIRRMPCLEEVGKVIGELGKGLQMHKCLSPVGSVVSFCERKHP